MSQPHPGSSSETLSKTDVMFKTVLLDDLQNLEMLLDGNYKSKESNVFVRDTKRRNLLHWAVQGTSGDSCIEFLLRMAPQLATEECNEGGTPLLHACYSPHVDEERIQLLLKINSTVNKPNFQGSTPLHAVVSCYDIRDGPNSKQDAVAKKKRKRQYLSLARLLIENGANVNAENQDGWSPLLIAIDHEKSKRADMDMIELLVNFGAKFCTQSGTNALILASCSSFLTHYILQQDSSGINLADCNGLTPLQHAIQNNEGCVINLLVSNGAKIDPKCISLARKYNISLDTILYLLNRTQPYDINTKDSDGKTLLIQYSYELDNVKRLLQLGADVNAVANDGSNALFTVMQQPHIKLEIVEALISAGADPALIDEKGCNIVSYACERFLRGHPESDSFALLKYLLQLPQFNDKSNEPFKKIDPAKHPQNMILSKLNLHPAEDQIFEILHLILESNFKDPSQVLLSSNLAIRNNSCIIFEPLKLGPISALLNNDKSQAFSENVKTYLDLMLKSGFSIQNTPAGTVTPLTLLAGKNICTTYVFNELDGEELNYTGGPLRDAFQNAVHGVREQNNDSDSEILTLVKKFIKEGVNVEDMSLVVLKRETPSFQPIHYNPDPVRQFRRVEKRRKVFDPALESLRRKLWLPDALWMAFITEKIDIVEILLPHWSAPPPALLLFIPHPAFKLSVKKWFPLISKFGAVPHGTEMCARLTKLLSTQSEELHAACFVEFKAYTDVMRSPLSLRELSRYAVRASVAERASQPGNSLPDLLASICPPGLKQYLLMKPT